MTRREFVAGSAALAAVGPLKAADDNGDFMRAALLHFGTNMWQQGEKVPKLDFDEQVWRRLTGRMVELKYNTVFVDVGEALKYPSHPEIAVEGSWEPERFRNEMRRLKSLGLEPIPKLNFSSTHNAWMGVYRRMTSTKKYYGVVKDLIRDAWEVFDHPRYFHIGMDEETVPDQTVHDYKFIVCRRNELLWHDYAHYVKCVEGLGMRAVAWGGMIRTHEDGVKRYVSRSVLFTIGYYREWFDLSMDDKVFPKIHKHNFRAFEKLDRLGFDIVPCTSNCRMSGIAAGLAKYCREHISPEHLKGIMTAPWEYSIPYGEPKCMAAIEELGKTWEG